MKSVFEASSGLDAHMVLNLLELHDISGRIEGEYLQGGIGELQAMGFVRVLVAEEDYDEARQVISDWEAAQPPDVNSMSEKRTDGGIQIFIAGSLFGAAVMYLLMKAVAA